jgi:hypothetical protein
MNYTFFAIACYIIMRGVQVLFAEYTHKKWYKTLLKVVIIIMLYAALASLVVWYKEIAFLGFSPGK